MRNARISAPGPGATRRPRVRGPCDSLLRAEDQNFSAVPGSSVMHFDAGPLQTDPVIGWLTLKVLSAVPDPPVTLPVILMRVAPKAHFPRVAWFLKVIFPFVVPLLAAHLIVMFSVPAVAPAALLNVPVPLPPVAASGVQFDTVA